MYCNDHWPKFTPTTKYIAVKNRHFREFVTKKIIQVFPVDTKEQMTDIFTKPLKEGVFVYLRRKLSGWLERDSWSEGTVRILGSRSPASIMD